MPQNISKPDPSQDKDFLAASPQDQHAYLMQTDKDYAGASRYDQAAYLAHVRGQTIPQPIPKTSFEKQRTEGDRGFLSGAKESLGLNQPPPKSPWQPLKDTLTDPGTYLGPGYGLAKTALGAPWRMAREWKRPSSTLESTAASAVSPFVGVDPDAMAARAEHADTSGILGQAAVPTAAAVAPLALEGGLNATNALRNKAASTLRFPATARQSQLGRPGSVKDILPPQLQRWTLPPWMIPKGDVGTPTNPAPFSEIPWKVPESSSLRGTPTPFEGPDVPFNKRPGFALGSRSTPGIPTGRSNEGIGGKTGIYNPESETGQTARQPSTTGGAQPPFEPLIYESETQANQLAQRAANLKRQASAAGTYHAAQGSTRKVTNLQQRIGKKYLPWEQEQ